MSDITKKKNKKVASKKLSKESTNPASQVASDQANPQLDDYESLTPWQKENIKYEKNTGGQQKWTPSVVQYEEAQKKKQAAAEEDTPAKDTEPETAPPIKELPKKQSYADKLPNLSRERSRRLKKRLVVILSILSLIFLGLLYYISPLSYLQAVAISGQQTISAETILESSNLVTGEKLWKQYFERTTAEKAILKNNPRIKTAEISWIPLNELKIAVTEYKVVAYSLEDSKHYDILENGVIVKDTTNQPTGNLPILVGFADAATIKDLLAVYGELSDELKNNISEIALTPKESNPYLLTIYMNDGNQVLVSLGDVQKKLPYYSQVVNQLETKGIIDMEASIFFEPYVNDATTNSSATGDEDSEKNNE